MLYLEMKGAITRCYIKLSIELWYQDYRICCSIIFDFTVKQIFENERERESKDFERVESSINLCDMHNSLRRRGERDKWDQRSLYNQRWMLIQECKMCVFRELNAMGTWTNYAKQMAERFLNAERERERVGDTRKFDIVSVESQKVSNFLLFLGFETLSGK